jgi:pSer/pThr/pTyr-binding forkhead associated (FHA) protein
MAILLLILRVLLVILLYTFLGVVLLTLWRDLRQVEKEHHVSHPKAQLVVLQAPEGQEETLTAGTTFPLQPITAIGRSPSNSIVIPDTYTSAQHALLTWRESRWWIEDRNSRNGTRLNGARIDNPAIVSAGDVIGVGRTELKLEQVEPPKA